jgi:CobB/CobQ-like glutamine amidotransferase domain
MTFEVGRRGKAGRLRKLRTPASGRLVGFENHSGRTYLGPGAAPLGRVTAGSGNNGEDGTEGARYREMHATYLHGPVLPKNPWLTDHLICRALRHRYGGHGNAGFLGAARRSDGGRGARRRAQAGRPQPAGCGRLGKWHGVLTER